MNVKCLIIDDEPLVRRSLLRVSEKKGHTVLCANDGVEGLTAWKESLPDLVFLDVLMPGLTGPEVLKEMLGQDHAKVILMSAYSGEYDLKTAQSMGADLFIPKPFDNIFDVIEIAEELMSGGQEES